jgi:hypothetical protein
MAAPTLPPPPLQDARCAGRGLFAQAWQRWLQQLQALAKGLGGALQPTTPALTGPDGSLFMGSGAPSNADGSQWGLLLPHRHPGDGEPAPVRQGRGCVGGHSLGAFW